MNIVYLQDVRIVPRILLTFHYLVIKFVTQFIANVVILYELGGGGGGGGGGWGCAENYIMKIVVVVIEPQFHQFSVTVDKSMLQNPF